jgi:WD40 repeat protein
VVFDPSGHYLATGHSDGVARLWDLDHDHAADRICATTRGILDTDMWARHIPQYDYAPPCS